LEKWIAQAIGSSSKEFITVATAISNKPGGIVNYSSNAALENFNVKLKMLKRKIRSIDDRDFFFFSVLNYYA
jgi:transposase